MIQHKYIRLPQFDEIIIFPEVIQHLKFKHMNPISAGFCHINTDTQEIRCHGESISLNLKSKKEDSNIATKQFFYI